MMKFYDDEVLSKTLEREIIVIKDTVKSLSVVSNNPDYLQNYEKKFKKKKSHKYMFYGE